MERHSVWSERESVGFIVTVLGMEVQKTDSVGPDGPAAASFDPASGGDGGRGGMGTGG